MLQAIEQRYDRVGTALFIAGAVFAVLSDLVHSTPPLFDWLFSLARDIGLLLGGGCLLVFGLRSIRREGARRQNVIATSGGVLIFLGAVAGCAFGITTVESTAETARQLIARSEDVPVPPREANDFMADLESTVLVLERTSLVLKRALVYWSVAALLCLVAGLFTPLRRIGRSTAA